MLKAEEMEQTSVIDSCRRIRSAKAATRICQVAVRDGVVRYVMLDNSPKVMRQKRRSRIINQSRGTEKEADKTSIKSPRSASEA